MHRRNWLVRGLCIAFAALLLFSGAWVTVHRQHDCVGDRCPVCAAISSWEQLLRGMAAAALCAGLLQAICRRVSAHSDACACACATPSLVALRVKLSD